MFDAQAWYARDVILGKITIPPLVDMQADSELWRSKAAQIESDGDAIEFQGDYVIDLMGCTDYPSFDVEGVKGAFMQWERDKREGE
jgi:trimethylamine monooxygenase